MSGQRVTKAELAKALRAAASEVHQVARDLRQGDPNRIKLKAIKAKLADLAMVLETQADGPTIPIVEVVRLVNLRFAPEYLKGPAEDLELAVQDFLEDVQAGGGR